jgi:hypothetical protein
VVARAPESETILLLAILNDPERFSTLAFVLAIFVLRVLFVVLSVVLVLLRLFERVLILDSSVVRRPKIVSKILEKAFCILSRRGAALNSVLDDDPLIWFIEVFQSSIHCVLVVWMMFVVVRTVASGVVCVEPVRTVVTTGSLFVNETRVPIHESSIIGFVRTYT